MSPGSRPVSITYRVRSAKSAARSVPGQVESEAELGVEGTLCHAPAAKRLLDRPDADRKTRISLGQGEEGLRGENPRCGWNPANEGLEGDNLAVLRSTPADRAASFRPFARPPEIVLQVY